MDKLSKRFPSGVKYDIFFNPTQFIQQSVNAVIETIGEAIVLVVLVVIFSCKPGARRSFRSSPYRYR